MKHVKHIFYFILLVLLAACGGGGGSSSSSPDAATMTVSGIASKGIIKGGTVTVYPVSEAGVKGRVPLATGKTDENGAYSITIASYSGPVVVEVYGTYLDEATGKEMTIPAETPLHAALDYVTAGKSFSLPVTPLTELAFRHAGALTAANIREANDTISYMMRLDIINTIPAAPTAEAFAKATRSQKDYALILAAVSQKMATDGKDLNTTLTSLHDGLSTTAAATALNSALSDFIANSNNQTGEAKVPTTLQNVGTVGKKLTLALSGDNVSSVQAFTATLTLPTGLMMRTDGNGVPLSTVFSLSSGAASVKKITYTAHYVAASTTTAKRTMIAYPLTTASVNSPATLTLAVLAPFGGLVAGDVITITCDVADNANTPAASDITLSGIDFRDEFGARLTGPELSLH
jgi:hypothetical protein